MSSIDASVAAQRRLVLRGIAAACAVASSARLAWAQATPATGYPARPIRLVVPSAAGGAPDAICRVMGIELATALGQPVVIDNKAGAGGAIGMSEVARAAPDGYTLGYGNVVTLAINKSLYAKLPYDPNALTSVALLGTVQNALVVRKDLPVANVRELIAYAKARPGQLTMGSAGNGTTGHLGGELFKSLTGTFITHVPYRGSPQAIQDLMGGQNDLIQESGVPGYETTAWGGIVGPKGLPGEIVTRLNVEINRILAMPAVRAKYATMAFETMASPANLLMTMAMMETPRWAEVIKRSGAKVE